MKLHLGCGERYLEGYRNIDYPPSEHTVQKKSVADEHHDITHLSFGAGTVDEVRMHHVFEHFSRAQACALLCAWHGWLRPGGRLHLEVPDFHRTVLTVLSPFSSKREKMVGVRHIFGSQEAPWAVHYDGYDIKRFRRILVPLGFRICETRRNSWMGTHNIEVIAEKTDELRTAGDYLVLSRRYLSDFCLDESADEKKMLEVWMKEFARQYDIAKPL